MRHRLLQVLSILLTITTVGAPFVCACPPEAGPDSIAPASPSCASDCCKPEPATPEQDQQPCEQCNLEHRADQPLPTTPDLTSGLHVLLVPPAVPDILWSWDLTLAPAHRRVEDVPAPPLLLDLFHTSVLLLV